MFGRINKTDVEISQMKLGRIGNKFNLIMLTVNPETGENRSVETEMTLEELMDLKSQIETKLNEPQITM